MKIAMSLLFAASIILGSVASFAQSESDDIYEIYEDMVCDTAADCPSPTSAYVCVNHRCYGAVMTRICKTTQDCPAYHVCASGRCQAN